MTTELTKAAQQALEVLESLQCGCTDHDDGTVEAITVLCPEVIEALRAALTQRPAAQTEREAWVPYLVDRADGVKGHYAIGRWNPRGYREVWNLHSHRWAAYSDDVMSLEEADSLLRQITIPTVRASLPTPQQATPASPGDMEVYDGIAAGYFADTQQATTTTALKPGWRWETFEHLRSTVVTAPNGVEYELRSGDISHPRAQRLFDAMFAALPQQKARE